VDSLPLTPETTSDVNTDIFDELIDTGKKHPDTFMCSLLNINSYRYKLLISFNRFLAFSTGKSDWAWVL
jgi:hypothetical protein